MIEQPRFWLKVTPAYVVENFEELLRYVSDYHYSIAEPGDSDFNVTVDCLCEVACGLIDRASEVSADERPEWDNVDSRKAIRIIAAAMLAELKRGRKCHYYVLALIRMLIQNNDVPFSERQKITSVIRNCAVKSPVRKLSVHFRDIFNERFFETTLWARIAGIEFGTGTGTGASHEGLGTVIFRNDRIEVVPMNLDRLVKMHDEIRSEIRLDSGVNVCGKGVKKPVSDVESLGELFPRLVSEFSSVKPSLEKKQKEYTVGDRLDVVVKMVNGVFVLCESVSPDYKKVAGKLYIDKGPRGTTREMLLSCVKVGDRLPAIFRVDAGFEFSLSHDEDDDFVEGYVDYCIGEPMPAVFQSYYNMGSRWLTECGLSVNILGSGFVKAGLADRDLAESVLKVRIRDCRRDNNGNLVVNGEVLPASEQDFGETEDPGFRDGALRELVRTYINFFMDPPEEKIGQGATVPVKEATETSVQTLGLFLMKTRSLANTESTFNRMSRMAVAALLMKVAGREADFEIARREFEYIRAAADFALGKSPMSLSFNPSPLIAELPKTKVECHIVDVLRSYRESASALGSSDLLIGEQFSMVEELVEASNILIDKIDVAELSRIKKNIVTKLGVADMYRDINRDRTFYGMESDNLEFKVSCARPPENRSTGSEREDINVQRFNILRTVCAFLNAPSGGDLLIGVNDEGYAAGLDSDIDILTRHRLIMEPNADRVGVYVKNQIDRAFVTDDGSARGNAITAGNVIVNVEESSDHKKVLRVKVNPYPYDVVRIDTDYCLKDCKDVYFRSSATSMSLSRDGIRNTRMRKLSALDRNEARLARVLEAIDNQRTLMLKGYHSHTGLTDRVVEPHCLALGQSAFQAFDHTSRQMRLFKLSRISEIEVRSDKWKYASKHRTRRVDIFGMMETDNVAAEQVTLKMTDFALMLLREEHPFPSDSELVEVSRNSGTDSTAFPWIVRLTVFHPAGYTRFVRGLPDYLQIV